MELRCGHLIRHFEKGSTELRKLDLRRDWENCTIKLGEHPSEFYGRLIALNSKMESMSAGCSNEDTQMRFVTSLEREESGIYKNAIQQYRGTIISGTTWSMSSLLEFVTHVYETSQATMRPPQQMNGLLTKEIKCDHCHKFGHVKKNCRYLKPKPMNKRNNYKITCYRCGKPGHMIRDCKEKNKNEVISILSLNNKEDDCTDCYYKTTFIDSGSSCHTVTVLNILERDTITQTCKEVNSVDGSKIELTHVGVRIIRTKQEVVKLTGVYFGAKLKYNLISVKQLVSKGVKLVLGESEAYFEKANTRIKLEHVDGLWAIPEVTSSGTVATLLTNEKADPTTRHKGSGHISNHKAKKLVEKHEKSGLAHLRTQRKWPTTLEIWHCRLGHPGERKLQRMVKDGIIPSEAAAYPKSICETCELTRPRKQPVPNVAKRSSKTVVQVDYMPLGRHKKGWKGEAGAYVFSSRSSKLLRAYPVTTASAEEAALTLQKYCTSILPLLGEQVDCIQTDAGTQFNSQEWKRTCSKQGLIHRTCPVDHQAMNGQVERTIGILAEKTRALLMDRQTSIEYWPLALQTATYLLNRTPHDSLGGMSPLERSTKEKPDLRRTRVFGCKAYVQIPKSERKGKLSNTAWTGTMVGYSTQSPEWIILDPKSRRLRYAYSVTFDEGTPGSASGTSDTTLQPQATEEIHDVESLTEPLESGTEALPGIGGAIPAIDDDTESPQQTDIEDSRLSQGGSENTADQRQVSQYPHKSTRSASPEPRQEENKLRSGLEKWMEGKYTPMDNKELVRFQSWTRSSSRRC